jgi:hypothetical protein
LGAALPPPPSAVVERLSADEPADWPGLRSLGRREGRPRSANRPRAPPLRA